PGDTDAELARRGQTREDYTMEVGQSGKVQGTLFLNSKIPVTSTIDAYLFGGAQHRLGYASGFYRLPYREDQVDYTLYPDGFLPEINPVINDWSMNTGLRGTSAGWRWFYELI